MPRGRKGLRSSEAAREVRKGSKPRAQGRDQQLGITRLVEPCHGAESLRQVRRAVSAEKQERDAARQQVVGEGINHRAVEIDVQDREVELLAPRSLHGVVERAERAEDHAAARLRSEEHTSELQ